MSDLVVKDNSLIEASYTLGLSEQRLILLAIVQGRETGEGLSQDTILQLTAKSYAQQFNISEDMAYVVMKESSESLFDRYVTYHDQNPQTGKDRSFKGRWVDKVGYEQGSGFVYLRFSAEVIPLITRLEKHFTSYEIEQVANLSSSYAIRLYELLIQWRSVGKTPKFELQDFRKKIGVQSNKYSRMSDFKKYVLDFAIEQVNKHTDITASYEQHKQGRKIAGFTFKFKQKSKSKDDIKDVVNTVTIESKCIEKSHKPLRPLKGKQLAMFAKRLSEDHVFGSIYGGNCKTKQEFAVRLMNELCEVEKVNAYRDHLLRVGFNPSFN